MNPEPSASAPKYNPVTSIRLRPGTRRWLKVVCRMTGETQAELVERLLLAEVDRMTVAKVVRVAPSADRYAAIEREAIRRNLEAERSAR